MWCQNSEISSVIMSECVFSVKGPELINMYVGQSEENIREGKSACYSVFNGFGFRRVEWFPLYMNVVCVSVQ